MNELKNHGKKWYYWFLLGLALIIVYKALDNFSDVMGIVNKFFTIITPFFVGIFIAYLLYLPCKSLEKKYSKSKIGFINNRARSLSILTVYIIAIFLIIILLNFILPVIVESVNDLINNLQGYYDLAISKYNELPNDSIFKSDVVNDAIKSIQDINIKDYIGLDKILEYVRNAIDAITSIFNIFVSFIVSIYVLSERKQILDFLKDWASVSFKGRAYRSIVKYFNSSNEIFIKFISSQFVDAIVVGIMVTIAMSIMKIKYAPLLGFLIGLFNMIPYVGAIIAVGISALITLITGGLTQTIWMLIIVTILQQIDANIINPKIVGQSLKISPLLVIFAITVGGAYFGMVGMFLSVPIIAIIRIIMVDYISYKKKLKKLNNIELKEN